MGTVINGADTWSQEDWERRAALREIYRMIDAGETTAERLLQLVREESASREALRRANLSVVH